MTVRYYPAREKKSGWIERFLHRHDVQHELVSIEEIARTPRALYGAGKVPAVEVDGRLFVNPNDDALRKILDLN